MLINQSIEETTKANGKTSIEIPAKEKKRASSLPKRPETQLWRITEITAK